MNDRFPSQKIILWKVSELTRFIREVIESEDLLQDVRVTGEISNLSKPSSGHFYFTLKDANASLRCVIWKQITNQLSLKPQDGDAVELHGKIGLYEQGGQYQLYVDDLRPIGEGDLYQEFLRRKTLLENEGIFDLEKKRIIPFFPQCIGIVTSPSGAAVKDVLRVIRRRFPCCKVVISPTLVQGSEASKNIIKAIRTLNDIIHPNVILLVRGGGSIEDLWSFNDQELAYEICRSQAPIISGVGHETDFTIADFAADLRASSPTAAAELATPNIENLIGEHEQLTQRLKQIVINIIRYSRSNHQELILQLRHLSPLWKIQSNKQRLDEFEHRRYSILTHRLGIQHVYLLELKKRLEALSPQAVLRRGYALITNPGGKKIFQRNQVSTGDELKVQVSDGSFLVLVR